MGNIASLLFFIQGKWSLRKLSRSTPAKAHGSSVVSSPSEVTSDHGHRQPPGANLSEDTPRTSSSTATKPPSIDTSESNQVLLTRANVTHIRNEMDLVLHRLDHLLSEDARNTLEESVVLAISFHLDDLQRSTRALNTILSAGWETSCFSADTEITGSSEDLSVEQPRCPTRLPTPDFDNSSMMSLLAHTESSSTYSADEMSTNLAIHEATHNSNSDLTTTPLRVLPLHLPKRNISVRSANGSLYHTPQKSPFDQEIRALDSQINSSSQLELNRPVSINSAEGVRQARIPDGLRSCLIDTPCPAPIRRHLSLDGHQSLGVRRCHKRQFSTEEKTQRLRALRSASTTPSPAGDGSFPAIKLSSEPLRMDELMEFLRDGNSIRQL